MSVDIRPVRRTAGHKANLRTVLVVNPNSCSGLTGKNWESLETKIKKILGKDMEVAFSEKPGHGTVLTRRYLRKGYRNVIAIGGDGTINEVANGFFEEPAGILGRTATPLKAINPDSVMGLVPCGTRNILAKSLGLPETVTKCCRNFAMGRPRRIDIIQATVRNQATLSFSSRVYLNAAEIGLGAEIIDRSRKVRKVVKNRILSTVTGILAALPSYQSNECEILLDRKHRESVKMTLAIVANGRFLAGGFEVAPDAEMNDGFLDVVVVKDSGSLKMLNELPSLRTGEYDRGGNILYWQARDISLESKERDVTVTVDGETIGILPATFTIVRRALTIRM